MNYSDFCNEFKPSDDELYLQFFHEFKDQFQVKNPRLAITKLQTILETTFRLVRNQSFSNMSMRALSEAAQLSIGGLYAYFSKKEQLADSIHHFLNHHCTQVMEQVLQSSQQKEQEELETCIRVHLYLSEYMQAWFFFAFMESKNLTKKQRLYAADSEQFTEARITQAIQQGQNTGRFSKKISAETQAALIKPLLHDWYLKRGKYKKRNIGVDDYAERVIQLIYNGIKA